MNYSVPAETMERLREGLVRIRSYTCEETHRNKAAQLLAELDRLQQQQSDTMPTQPDWWMVADENWNQCFTTKEQAGTYGTNLIPLYRAAPHSSAPMQTVTRKQVRQAFEAIYVVLDDFDCPVQLNSVIAALTSLGIPVEGQS